MHGASSGHEPLEVRDGARRTFVRPDEICWIEAAGNYAELHLASRSLLHRASLASLAQRLAPAGFARIHRARLVNRRQIAALATNAAGDFTVTLRDGRELAGSRRFRAEVTTGPEPRPSRLEQPDRDSEARL
jgi:DNA-binding LytR/AlgR family response regulator